MQGQRKNSAREIVWESQLLWATDWDNFENPGETDPFRILSIEDNLADVDLTKEALRDADCRISMRHIGDGEQAIRYVNEHADTLLLPDLILLDVNLPRKSGFEVLEIIKKSNIYASET